jgi:hypothetical protein
MKVYGLPEELEATIPEIDYVNFDYDAMIESEDIHRESIKQWLLDNGYTGKHTGGILRMPIADGHAEYMLADGNPSILIHLPYGDAWNHPDVTFLPKKEIVKRIQNDEAMRKLFSKAS